MPVEHHRTDLKKNLRGLLAELYPRDPDIERLLCDAGLRRERFNLDDSAINDWENVLEEASKEPAAVRDIVDVATREYRNRRSLLDLRQQIYEVDGMQAPPLSTVPPRSSVPEVRAPATKVTKAEALERHASPGWREMVLGVLFRPAWLREQIVGSVPEVLTEPYLASLNAPNGTLPRTYSSTSARFVVALCVGVTLLVVAGCLSSYTIIRGLFAVMNALTLTSYAVPAPCFGGLMLGLAVGLTVGLVIGGSFGISTGVTSGVAAGVSVGVQYAAACPVLCAIGWGTTLGLMLSLFPSIVHGRHLRRYINVVVCAVMTVAFTLGVSLWTGQWGHAKAPLAAHAEVAFAALTFFTTALVSSMRLLHNLLAIACVSIAGPALTEPQALARLVRSLVRYGEHFQLPIPYVRRALRSLADARRSDAPDHASAYAEALADCRRCPALARLADTIEAEEVVKP